MIPVCGRSPHDPAERTAFADARLPKDLALLVGVHRMDHAGFLPDHEQAPAVRQGHKDRRLTKVMVGAIVVRAVDPVTVTAHDIAVVWSGLLMPELGPGLEVERDHRIAGIGWGVRVAVAGRDIERLTFGVDRRRRPHGCTGWTKKLSTHSILFCRPRLLGDRISLPDLSAGPGVECDHAAAKRAALITAARSHGFLAGGDGHVEHAGIQCWRA